MAKRNKVTIEESVTDLPQENLTIYTEVEKKEDPMAEKVRNLKAKGYNDNQIAAMLMIQKHIVENIK